MLPIPEDQKSEKFKLILRLNSLGSLFFFEKFVLQRNKLTRHLHKPILDKLESDLPRFLFEMPRDHLKALDVNTPIPTPNGFKLLKDIQIGDVVYGGNGCESKVLGKSNTWRSDKVYRVEFSTGDFVIADAGHLWITDDKKTRENKRLTSAFSVKTTEQIKDTIFLRGEHNHRVHVTGVICQDKNLPVSPYTLGAWLGDGDSAGAVLTCATQDTQTLEEIQRDGFIVSAHKDPIRWGILGLHKKLRVNNLLKNKHIPSVYLRSGDNQRLAILQGLMDTDGSISKEGQCFFGNTNLPLVQDFRELLCSLGIKASYIMQWPAKLNGRVVNQYYCVSFYPDIPVFRLKRKLERQRPLKRCAFRFIRSVDSVEPRDVCCLMVDSIDHTYLVSGAFIPTHNTTMVTEGRSIWTTLPFNEIDEICMRDLGYDDAWIRWMRYIHNPGRRRLIVSEVLLNAVKIGLRFDWHFKDNDRFKLCFPEILPDASCIWTQETKQIKTKLRGPNGEGTYDFLGIGGALQSRHYTDIDEDDVVGRDAVKSDLIMADVHSYHQLLMGAFVSVADGIWTVTNNRWAPNDLSGWIRENNEKVPVSKRFIIEHHSALGGCCERHLPGQIIFPEEFSQEDFDEIRETQGPYYFCLPETAPILLPNFEEKPISDIVVGDEVVGFEFGKKGQYAKLTKTMVKAKCSFNAPTVKVTMESGRSVICTPNHKWFVADHQHRHRKPYREPVLGLRMARVISADLPKTPQEQRDLDWLGGILDGEGSVNGCVFISQSPEANPIVCNKLKEITARLGIPFKGTNPHNSWYMEGGRSLKVRLIRHAQMAKKQRFIDWLWNNPGRIVENGGVDKIISIEPAGEQTVYGIETETGNYVAYGYASANSHQYLNLAVNPEECIFKREWLRYYKAAPSPIAVGKHWIQHEVKDGETIPDVNPRVLIKSIVVDPNHAEERGRSRHALAVTGFDPETDRIYLLDVWAKSSSYDDLVYNLYRLARMWGLTEYWLEENAAQTLLRYPIEYRAKTENFNLTKRTLKGSRAPNAKRDRIESLEPLFRQGQIWVRHDQNEFLDEYFNYPASRTFDVLDVLGYSPQAWNAFHARKVLDIIKKRREQHSSRHSITGY